MATPSLLKLRPALRGVCSAALLLVVAAAAPAQRLQLVRNQPAADDAPPSAAVDFVPKGLALLTQNASWHTDLTFDRSMLAVAGKLEGLDEPTRQAIARLNGVTVHSYRYSVPDEYNNAELDSIRAQYDALGWKHVVSRHGKAVPEPEGKKAERTDVWIQMNGMNIAGVAVLLTQPSNVNLVAVSGDISTVDLLHLRGHFGIPKFNPDDIGK